MFQKLVHTSLLLVSTGCLSAATLAQWIPTSGDATASEYNNSGQTPSATTVAADVSVSPLDRVNQPTIGNTGNVWPGYVANYSGAPVNTVGNYDATTGAYTEFVLTPDSGFTIDFSFLTYQLNSYGGMNDAGGYTGVIRTSVDAFASELDSDTITGAGSGNFSFDLSSLTDVTSAITFRLYFINNEGGATWADLAPQNGGLIVDGTVSAVPEPAGLTLLGLAGAAFLLLRRRP